MTATEDVYSIESLTEKFGPASHTSPLGSSIGYQNFIDDENDKVLADFSLKSLRAHQSESDDGTPPAFEMAGPREKLFWGPETTKVAIVTCGGLAPGLNTVIQSIVSVLHNRYGVTAIFGVPFGYYGFYFEPESKKFKFGWRRLDPLVVQHLDSEAGSTLGTSRGNSDPKVIVDALVLRNINIVFTIGGDGTLAGANAIHNEIKKRNLPIAVIGIPKTIDNDILWVSKSFGFDTAVGKAVEAIRCAQTEASSAYHGIGIVKLMGRHSGSLTATAAVAVNGIDFVLVPEVEVFLEGQSGFLHQLVNRVENKGYATIAIAEGAGQNLFSQKEKKFDASGNVKLNDIGKHLQERIVEEFKRREIETSVKYIDPSYILRAQPASADDSLYCTTLGQHAVHAAMAGKTGLMIGHVQGQFVHVPLKAVTRGKKKLNTNGTLWQTVLSTTGQPPQWNDTTY